MQPFGQVPVVEDGDLRLFGEKAPSFFALMINVVFICLYFYQLNLCRGFIYRPNRLVQFHPAHSIALLFLPDLCRVQGYY